jgi:hypothetical protein
MPKDKILISVTFLYLIFIFLLSDFYYIGFGRPFDYIGILFIIILYTLRPNLFNKNIFLNLASSILLIISPWIIVGFLNDNYLAAAVFLFGSVIVLPLFYSLENINFLKKVEAKLILITLISIIALTIQSLTYYVFNSYIDLHQFFGSIESRGLNIELNYFRSSGFYQEPNAYCTVMFCLLSLCMFFSKRNYYLEILGILSMLFTQSLWGFGGAIILVYLLYGFKNFLKFLSSVFLFFTVLYFIFQDYINNIMDQSVTFNRILNIENDPSRVARYGTYDNVNFDIFLIIGHGIDTQNFQVFAANGMAFLLYAFGVIGFFILLIFILFITRFNIRILLSIGFLLTTFPQFSYIFFWTWLGLMLAFRKYFYNEKILVN